MTDAGWQLLPHTADVRLAAWAPSRQGLYEALASGLFGALEGRGAPSPTFRWGVQLEREAEAELLVAWLNTLLYWHETSGAWPASISVAFPARHGLLAAITGGGGVTPGREIKAATYHGLALSLGPQWRAAVILDL